MKNNLKTIPVSKGHNNSVNKKVLVGLGQDNGQIATFNYAWLEKGNVLEQHVHPDGKEYYLFLEGEGEMLVDKEWLKVKIGDFVTVPEYSVHSLKNLNEKQLVFMTLRSMRKN